MVEHDEQVDHGTGEAGKGGDKAFDASNAGEPGPGREVSDKEEVSATDTSAQSPLGVGESMGSRAEDIADDSGEGVTEAGRPYGKKNEDV